MMQRADNIKFYRLDDSAAPQVFTELSALDVACVGSEGWSAESFRSEAAKSNGIVIYCRDDIKITGLICGYFAADEADITSVAVAPECRCRGIASGLMAEFESCLPENTEEIFLEVRESNSPAIGLYTKCGFEKLSVRKNFYDNPPENAVVMRKKRKEK